MELDVISQYVLAIAPSVVSIISMIATIVVAIRKMRDSSEEVSITNEELKSTLNSLAIENIQLKEEIRKNIRKIGTVDEIKAQSKKGK